MPITITLDLQKFYPKEMEIAQICQGDKEIFVKMFVRSKSCKCPKCSTVSKHRHGTYERKIQDFPILGKSTYLLVNTYEYQCDNPSCDMTIFAENINGFLNYYSCMTDRCTDFICTLAQETSCEGCVRICRAMNLRTSGDSVIRLLVKRYSMQPEAECGSIIGWMTLCLRRGTPMGESL